MRSERSSGDHKYDNSSIKMETIAFTVTAEEELMNALKACGPMLKEAVNISTDCTSEVKSFLRWQKKAQKQSVDEDSNDCDWKLKQEIPGKDSIGMILLALSSLNYEYIADLEK
jgi:hypothetical protein